jgi:hypothetical protein
LAWVIHIPEKNNVRFIWNVAKVRHIFAKQLTTHTMTNANTINKEIIALATNASFVKKCAEIAKRNGITSQDWNQDKVHILYMWATQVVCSK